MVKPQAKRAAVRLAQQAHGLSERRGCRLDAQEEIEAWRKPYSWERPHSSLGGLAPTKFAEGLAV